MTTADKPLDSTSGPQPPKPGETSRRVSRQAGGWLFRVLLIAPVVVGAFLVVRYFEFRHLETETEEQTVPTVQVTQPEAGPATIDLTLPGDLAAFSDASLYARTDGYLKKWNTDLGAKVAAGQVMAEISAPDVDARLRQAQAALSETQSKLEIARLNFQREQDLLNKRVASQQEFDQSRASYESAGAAVQAAQANVQNLTVQQDFQKIIAPFPGTVTQRSVDVGDLVTAGNTDSTADDSKALFRLARTDILRVFIDVPQIYSAKVSTGTRAFLTLEEFPGEKFEGHISNISGALDPATRTLRTEVQVPNPDGRLFPGAYAQVHLILPVKPTVVVPSNTLIFRGDGLQVAVVDADGGVHLRPVTIGHDFGKTVEIATGLAADDAVVVNPPDSITDGLSVKITSRQ